MTFPRSLVSALSAGLALALIAAPAHAQGQCSAPANEIVAENCRTVDPAEPWEVNPSGGAGDPGLQGFATDISVDQGQTVNFKVDTDASAFTVDIFRMGWYGGEGARPVTASTLGPFPGQNQPACQTQVLTGPVDCGNWAPSASWTVPAGAVSGIYFARLVRQGTPLASHIPFIVRDDDGRSDLLFQTADTTWQAYNSYGDQSFYFPTQAERAYKVSYNRPFNTRAEKAEDWLFNAEYPMVRWLERNGYDVSYSTGVDSDRLGAELREHRTFLSVGHDEYWSHNQRANVEAARDAGVNLAFFSGNEVFWKTRWENGYRTLVSYKETHDNAKIDPSGVWTGTWRDPRPFNPEGPRPENALTGTIFTVNCCTIDLEVPSAEGRLRLWRNTSVSALPPGTAATLSDRTVGYEWDEDLDNGARPPGLVRLSSATTLAPQRILDYGSTYGDGTATHSLTMYRDTNGAGPDSLVFGAGTVQWSWGLDGEHDRGGSTPSAAMQQATVNLFADMGVQPATLQGGLTPVVASTDCTPPVSSPSATTLATTAGTPATASGIAVDGGGGRVGGVEVSVDGGNSWHPASGRESWSYTWTPSASGQVSVRSRAADDSGHLEGLSCDALSPPAGPTASPRPRDSKPPRMRVRPRRIRVSPRGWVRMRVTCPAGEKLCRVVLRLRRRDVTLAYKKFRVTGGKTRKVSLRLTRRARRRLAHSGSLEVVAVAAARDAAGNRAVTRTRIRLLRPRR